MITLATYTLNILYPGFLLGDGRTWKQARADTDKHFDNESNATFNAETTAVGAQEPKL